MLVEIRLSVVSCLHWSNGLRPASVISVQKAKASEERLGKDETCLRPWSVIFELASTRRVTSLRSFWVSFPVLFFMLLRIAVSTIGLEMGSRGGDDPLGVEEPDSSADTSIAEHIAIKSPARVRNSSRGVTLMHFDVKQLFGCWYVIGMGWAACDSVGGKPRVQACYRSRHGVAIEQDQFIFEPMSLGLAAPVGTRKHNIQCGVFFGHSVCHGGPAFSQAIKLLRHTAGWD